MPLMQGKSKKSFQKNVKTEMEHGKPQPQALAIAYSVKRKSPKKKASGGAVESGSKDMNMADGGDVSNSNLSDYRTKHAHLTRAEHAAKAKELRSSTEGMSPKYKANMETLASYHDKEASSGYAEGGEISAKNEKRPMPESEYDDTKSISRNSAKAAPRHGDRVLEDTSGPAHNKPKVQPIKHPKMVPQSAYSTRLRDEEEHLQNTANPGPYDEQPNREYDEEGPDRQGPPVHDMEDEHSTRKKPYAKGGEVESSDYNARPNRYEDDLLDLPPSEDEGSMMAHSENEEGPDRHGPEVPDMEDSHVTGRKPYQEGGHVDSDDAESSPTPTPSDDDETLRKRKEVSDSFKSAFAEGGTIQFHDAEHTNDEDDHNPATRRQIYADEMTDQPSEEEELARQSSLAAAVMAKMKRFAKGGEITEGRDHDDILSHRSIESDPKASQVDLRRNAEEDANEEDQLSFDALMKENYSESDGLDALDQPNDSNLHGDPEERDAEDHHDKSAVSKILSKMRKRSPIQDGGSGR